MGLIAEEPSKKTEGVSSLRGKADRKSVELNELNEKVTRKLDEIEKVREERYKYSQDLSEYNTSESCEEI